MSKKYKKNDAIWKAIDYLKEQGWEFMEEQTFVKRGMGFGVGFDPETEEAVFIGFAADRAEKTEDKFPRMDEKCLIQCSKAVLDLAVIPFIKFGFDHDAKGIRFDSVSLKLHDLEFATACECVHAKNVIDFEGDNEKDDGDEEVEEDA